MSTVADPHEVDGKLERVRGLLANCDLDGALFTGQDTVTWVTGGIQDVVLRGRDPGFVWALVTRDSAYLITNNVEEPRLIAEERPERIGFEVVAFPWYEDAYAATVERLCDPLRLANDGAGPGTPRALELQKLRLVLSPGEQNRLATTAREATQALEDALRGVRHGVSEREIAARIAERLERAGIVPSLMLAAADDRHMRFRHPTLSDTPVTRDVLGVIVAARGGLYVAATRSVSLGAPEPEFARRHDIACQVEARMIEASRPGATWSDAMEAGVKAYDELGFPREWQHHVQGGPIGYGPREFVLGPASHPTPFADYPVLQGQAAAWNPTVQGAKSENTFIVGPNSNQVVSITSDWPTIEAGRSAGGSALRLPGILELHDV